MPLRLHGIRAIDLDRGPGPDDWLVIAIGSDRLVPVRAGPVLHKGRLGVVVHTAPPPDDEALAVLARLVEDKAAHRASEAYGRGAGTRWAWAVAARLDAAISSTHGHRAAVA
jgi:hypothetical protein